MQVEPVGWPERRITTGFADPGSPETALGPEAPLVAGRRYYFWIEVGPAVAPANGNGASAGPCIDVALFALGDGADVEGLPGALRLVGDDSARVERQPVEDVPELADRLLFPVTVGATGGTLRCSLYHRNVLLWSQLVKVPAGTAPRLEHDFGIAPALDPHHLAALTEHQLSVLLNSDGEGTHALTFSAPDGFKAALTLSPDELQELLEELRGGLCRAAWGDVHEWTDGRPYRYETLDDVAQLHADLRGMATRGARYYDFLTEKLVDAGHEWRPVREAMRTPGRIQIASKESPSHVFPAALIYDRPFDDTLTDSDAYTLCPAFLDALKDPGALASSACFAGHCPSWGERAVICPSGFWGFRHEVGTTLSMRGGRDIATEIGYAPSPRTLMAVSTDPGFSSREAHEAAIRRLCPPDGFDYAPTREHTLAALKAGHAHLVYFYCHGGVQDRLPILHVGGLSDPVITSAYLREEGVEWVAPRPLVVLNGCRTTAVEPRHALQFVGGWLKHSRAAGVVGTEITVFEPLAGAFAEACLGRFLGGEPLGTAIREARLDLLERCNPLGLAYTAFALTSLRLVAEPVAAWAIADQPATEGGDLGSWA